VAVQSFVTISWQYRDLAATLLSRDWQGMPSAAPLAAHALEHQHKRRRQVHEPETDEKRQHRGRLRDHLDGHDPDANAEKSEKEAQTQGLPLAVDVIPEAQMRVEGDPETCEGQHE